MYSQEKTEIEELKVKFDLLYKNETAKDFLAGLMDYLQYIEDTPFLKTKARKVMTNKPSMTIATIFNLYKGLRKVWDENYNPIDIVWADMNSMFVGRPSKYGFPMTFSDLRYARSATRLFHAGLLEEINQQIKIPYFEGFDSERGILTIGGTQIILGKRIGSENNQIRLLATLIKDPYKVWSTDELVEDWEGAEMDIGDIPKNRFYDPAYKLNTTIEVATGIQDFIEHTTKKININPQYLKKE
ncbi:MAG: hypothetical protein WC791_00520 [Candidatus Paceibacterota bacterium]|jgi:hypothetical protein